LPSRHRYAIRRRSSRTLVLLGLAACLACSGAQAPRAPIEARIAELEREIGPSRPANSAESQGLRAAKQAVRAGYLFAAVYELEEPIAEIAAERYAREKRELAKAGLAAFEGEWQAAGKELGAKHGDAELRALPAAVRSLVEAARAQSEIYYRAARLYGEQAAPGSGLYYVGLARGYLDFANFAAGLRFPSAPQPSAPPLGTEIAALQETLSARYESRPAMVSPGRFNAASATLKFAGELARLGKPDAALQTFLDATLAVGLLEAPAKAAAPDVRSLEQRSRALRERVEDTSADPSIGLLYWELAQGGLAERVKGGAAAAGTPGVKRTQVILDDVLPRFLGIQAGVQTGFLVSVAAAAPGAAAVPARQPVTVTIVRWPFT
jgi:hypothetical protein